MADHTAEITPETLATWMTPAEALAHALFALNTNDNRNTGRAIWERVLGGLIRTACSQESIAFEGKTPAVKRIPSIIPGSYWHNFTEAGSNFWSGDARFFFGRDARGRPPSVVRCIGLRLNPDDVRSTLPAPSPSIEPSINSNPSPPAPAPAAIDKGGRPRKAWWDDLWAEMARQLYVGDLQPKRQADIEKAMADWVFALGEEASERSIRDAARKLWRAINDGGKN